LSRRAPATAWIRIWRHLPYPAINARDAATEAAGPCRCVRRALVRSDPLPAVRSAWTKRRPPTEQTVTAQGRHLVSV